MSPIRRDAEGRREAARDWESLIDRQIREARERGEFDGLPGHGKPLALPDDRYTGDMALAFSMLRGTGFAPPWIEADKEVRRLLEERDRRLRLAAAWPDPPSASQTRTYGELLERIDRAIDAFNALAPSARLQRRRLDRVAQLETYRSAHEQGGA